MSLWLISAIFLWNQYIAQPYLSPALWNPDLTAKYFLCFFCFFFRNQRRAKQPNHCLHRLSRSPHHLDQKVWLRPHQGLINLVDTNPIFICVRKRALQTAATTFMVFIWMTFWMLIIEVSWVSGALNWTGLLVPSVTEKEESHSSYCLLCHWHITYWSYINKRHWSKQWCTYFLPLFILLFRILTAG